MGRNLHTYLNISIESRTEFIILDFTYQTPPAVIPVTCPWAATVETSAAPATTASLEKDILKLMIVMDEIRERVFSRNGEKWVARLEQLFDKLQSMK